MYIIYEYISIYVSDNMLRKVQVLQGKNGIISYISSGMNNVKYRNS